MDTQQQRNATTTTATTTQATGQPAYLMAHIEAALALSDLPAPAAQAVYPDAASDEDADEQEDMAHVPFVVRLIPDADEAARGERGPRTLVWSLARFEMTTGRTNNPIIRGSYATIMALAHDWQNEHPGLLWRSLRRADGQQDGGTNGGTNGGEEAQR